MILALWKSSLRSVALSIVVLAGLQSNVSAQTTSPEVKWLSSARQASELARQTGRPILIYVRSETCHFCDLMQRDVWSEPKTAEVIMREFVPLKLNREQNAEAVKAMKVKGFPSTLLFSPNHDYIGRLDGYLNNHEFLRAISNLRAEAYLDSGE